TPGKIGEFSRVFFINKHIDSKLKSLSLVIFDRIIDLIIVFEIGVLSIIYICFKTGYFSFGQAVLYSILSAALFFISWLLIKTPKFIIEFIIKKLIFFLNKIAEKILNISESFRQFNYFDIMIWNFITVISWLCYFFQAFLISRSVNLDISYFTVIAVISISSIIAILPISTAGIGPREFTIINILKYFDITSETAFSFSIMFLITIYLSVFSGHLSALFFIKSK
ncbi:MAG TPA: lysylphosphatidylglycerol synthase transmembrane domain-containing protein, partial [bacterium]|nr:lysylphosphatidylglycerol synthase transmembrane domain-containing protein [bacterium]